MNLDNSVYNGDVPVPDLENENFPSLDGVVLATDTGERSNMNMSCTSALTVHSQIHNHAKRLTHMYVYSVYTKRKTTGMCTCTCTLHVSQ